MGVFNSIDKILAKAVIDGAFGIPHTFTNEDFKPSDHSSYLNCTILPSPVLVATLGDNGCDDHSGIFQIDIRYREGTGITQHKKTADVINIQFANGKYFTDGEVSLRIENVSIAPLLIGGGWASLPMTIEYQVYSRRVSRI